MSIERKFDIDGIPIYIDEHMEEDKILKGRKQGSVITFLVVNPKTGNRLYEQYKHRQREKKLKRILYESNCK